MKEFKYAVFDMDGTVLDSMFIWDRLIDDVLKKLDIGNDLSVRSDILTLNMEDTADYLIDLGPESGDGGGEVVTCGTPEQVADCKKSYTGQFLKPILSKAKKEGRYKDISAFIDTARLEEEQYDILTGPRVRRRIREETEDNGEE